MASYLRWWACIDSLSCSPKIQGNTRLWRWPLSPQECWQGRWARMRCWWKRTWSGPFETPQVPPQMHYIATAHNKSIKNVNILDKLPFLLLVINFLFLSFLLATLKCSILLKASNTETVFVLFYCVFVLHFAHPVTTSGFILAKWATCLILRIW